MYIITESQQATAAFIPGAYDKLNNMVLETTSNQLSLDPLRYQASTLFGTLALSTFALLKLMKCTEKYEIRESTMRKVSIDVLTLFTLAKEKFDMTTSRATEIDYKDLGAAGIALVLFYLAKELKTPYDEYLLKRDAPHLYRYKKETEQSICSLKNALR